MSASLKLILTGAAGNDLNDNLTIDLFSLQSSTQYQVNQRVQREITINQIDISGGPTFRVMVTPANHRIVQFFVMLSDGKTTEFSAASPDRSTKGGFHQRSPHSPVLALRPRKY